MPNNLHIYEGITGLRIRPYIEKVLQCFNYYRFEHLSKYCKGKKSVRYVGRKIMGIVIRILAM